MKSDEIIEKTIERRIKCMNFCNGTEKLETVDVGTNQLLGALFDFYAGTLRRSTKIWIKSRFGLASKTN